MRKSGHSQVVSPHCGFDLPMGKLAAALRRAVVQYIAAAFIETQAQHEFLGRDRLRQVLARREPVLDQRAVFKAQRTQFLGKLGSLGPHAVVFAFILRFGNARNRRPDRPVVIEWLLFKIVEEGAQRVEVLLRGRIVLVIVAYGTTHGQAHECCAVGLRSFARNVHAQFFGNGSSLVAAHAQAHIPARDQRIEILCRQQVARDLLHRKLIEGLVAVEGTDKIVAERPDIAAVVVVQSIRVGIARIVEPIARSLFAKTRLGQQADRPDAHTLAAMNR